MIKYVLKFCSLLLITSLVVYDFFGLDISSAASLKVAAIQYRAVPFKKSKNINKLINLVTKAAEKDAKIIVLPEMCTTGLFIKDKKKAINLAESIPGPTTNEFAKLAKQYGIYIILGLPEFDLNKKKYYNSQIIVDDKGQIIGKYRKIHLFGPDFNWANEGDLGYQVIETSLGKIGLGICYDINFSELLDVFCEKGVDIFAFSTNWISQRNPLYCWSNLLRDKKIYFIAANNWGNDNGVHFVGNSVILSRDLTILAKAHFSSNTILYAQIEIKKND